jgi:hypothetical protein
LRLVGATAVEFGFCCEASRIEQRLLGDDEDCASGLSYGWLCTDRSAMQGARQLVATEFAASSGVRHFT